MIKPILQPSTEIGRMGYWAPARIEHVWHLFKIHLNLASNMWIRNKGPRIRRLADKRKEMVESLDPQLIDAYRWWVDDQIKRLYTTKGNLGMIRCRRRCSLFGTFLKR